MKIKDLLQEVWVCLLANKGRSALTVLGIVIGIAAVISMTSLVGGIQHTLSSTLGLARSKHVYIQMTNDRDRWQHEDIKRFKDAVSEFEALEPFEQAYEHVTTHEKQFIINIKGGNSSTIKAMGQQLALGALFTPEQELGNADVCVVAKKTALKLFKLDNHGMLQSTILSTSSAQTQDSGDAQNEKKDESKALSDTEKNEIFEKVIGQTLKIKDRPYRIVGVVEDDKNLNFGTETLDVYIPYQNANLRFENGKGATMLLGVAKEKKLVESAVKKSEEYIKRRFNYQDTKNGSQGPKPFYVQSVDSLAQGFNAFMSGFQMIVAAIAGISLLVGGIGIMNMMLTNVYERIHEIGLRKALGAKNADIVSQFLLEACALCVIGGTIGMLLGLGISTGLASIVSVFLKMPVGPAVSIDTVALAEGVSILTGIIFGYYPAQRAARLNPVEALHYQ